MRHQAVGPLSERARLIVDLAAIVALALGLWISRPMLEVPPGERVPALQR